MKKFLSITLALVLALSLSVTAFAAGGDTDTGDVSKDTVIQPDPDKDYAPNPETGNTSVSYTVAPAYTVTIPEKVTIDGAAVTVKAEGVKVGYGKQVVVKLTGINESDDTFQVKTTQGASLDYTVKSGDTTIKLGDTVLEVASGLDNETDANGNKTGASTGSANLAFILDDTAQYAGEYSGTVTFTVEVADSATTIEP